MKLVLPSEGRRHLKYIELSSTKLLDKNLTSTDSKNLRLNQTKTREFIVFRNAKTN